MSAEKRLGSPRLSPARGATLIELLLAVFLAGIVMLAASIIYLTNQRSFRQGRDKVLVQQNVTWCLEELARDIRHAWRADLSAGQVLVLYDVRGQVLGTWERSPAAGGNRVKRNNFTMAPEECTVLGFSILNPDSSTVGVALELMDAAENRVRIETKASLRNHDVGDSLSP